MSVAAPRRTALVAGRRPAAATVVLVVLMLAAGGVLLYAGHHLTYFFDEWSFIQYRRGDGLRTFLDPNNGHFSLFPVLVYKLLFAVAGLRPYTPYRAVEIVLHLACAALLYLLIRRRVGPWLALAPVTLLLFMGTASQDLLWAFQMGFLASVAGGLGALALIEHRRSDALATALLVWSIASSGIGIPFLLASLVLLLARGDPWRRLSIVAVPALVYAIWYVGWGTSDQSPITLGALLAAPAYVATAAGGASAGIAGLPFTWAPALAVGALLAFALAWRSRPPTPMLVAAATGALSFWLLTAVARSHGPDPTASRYLYVGAVFIWLIAAEAVAPFRFRGAVGLGLAGLLALGALVANLGVLRKEGRGLREYDDNQRASLTAVQIAAPVVSPGFLVYRRAPIFAGPYLAAERDLGSPAFSIPELLRAPFSLRQLADQALVLGERLTAAPISGKPPCSLVVPVSRSGTPVAPGQTIELRNAGPLTTKIYLRRFASAFTPPTFTVLTPHARRSIRFPRDGAPVLSWHVVGAPAGQIKACLA
jgi:hypothetical protein